MEPDHEHAVLRSAFLMDKLGTYGMHNFVIYEWSTQPNIATGVAEVKNTVLPFVPPMELEFEDQKLKPLEAERVGFRSDAITKTLCPVRVENETMGNRKS